MLESRLITNRAQLNDRSKAADTEAATPAPARPGSTQKRQGLFTTDRLLSSMARSTPHVRDDLAQVVDESEARRQTG